MESNALVVTTASVAVRPSKLARPAIGKLSSATVMLSWAKSDEPVVRYEIARGDLVVCCEAGDFTTFTDIGLMPSTTYTYRVRAFNAIGASSFSDEASATTAAKATSAPDVTAAAAVTFSLDRTYTADLADSATNAFEDLASEIEAAVSLELASIAGEHSFAVLSFASGSIIVKGRLQSSSTTSLAAALAQLQDAVSEKTVGSLPVQAESFSSEADDNLDASSPASTPSSSTMIIGIGAGLGAVIVVLVILVVVQWQYLKRHNAVSAMVRNPCE